VQDSEQNQFKANLLYFAPQPFAGEEFVIFHRGKFSLKSLLSNFGKIRAG